MKKQIQQPFGLHLMLELYNCDPKVLSDKSLVKRVLDELPEEIGMHKLIDPVVVFAQSNEKRDPGGWSGFVIIQESHISLHTFIRRRFVTADVYSCKQFDAMQAIAYFKKIFHTDDIEYSIEQRGIKYPQENID
jgi:S-adenosylmethionine decarboxylase